MNSINIIVGFPGITGPPGLKGEPGEIIPSNYVDTGDLKGLKGETGPPGDDGPQGNILGLGVGLK